LSAWQCDRILCGGGKPTTCLPFVVRMGIFEMLMINDELREMIVTRKSAGQMQEVARKKYGLQLMREDGWNKVRLGLTTIDEIVRVTQAVL
jgi:type II secretory ATPase GspE/PulE/Tfp pilus assembly ATPase PilB-like protein